MNQFPGKIYLFVDGQQLTFEGDISYSRAKIETEAMIHMDGSSGYVNKPVLSFIEAKLKKVKGQDELALYGKAVSVTVEADNGERLVMANAIATGKPDVDMGSGNSFTIKFEGDDLRLG
jgi:hypothetical protein